MIKKMFKKKNHLLLFGLTVFTLIVLGTVVFPMVSPYTWNAIDSTQKFRAPSSTHFFGTTERGLDLFTCIWIGGRTSLFIAIIGTLPYTLIGSFTGIVGGYFGKKFDFVLSQIMTFIYAMPLLPLIMMLSFVLRNIGLNTPQVVYTSIIIYSLFSAPTLYKIIRVETIRINSEEYMKAAELIGIGSFRRIIKHLLPNLSGQIIVAMIQFMSQVLIFELILFFFGVSFMPLSTTSWGSLIPNLSGPNTFKDYYWIWLFPILTVSVTTISLKFISEGLRIAYDPKVEDSH